MMARSRFGRRARIARAAFAIVSLGAAAISIFIAPGARGILGAGLALVMSAIALYDARYFIIPNWLNAAALALAIVNAAVTEPEFARSEISLALMRGAVAGGSFMAVRLGYQWLRGREGIGMGDIKLAAVAGVWLDWVAIPVAIEIAAVAALGTYLVRFRIVKRTMRANNALPFGLYFAPAIWAGWLIESVLFTV